MFLKINDKYAIDKTEVSELLNKHLTGAPIDLDYGAACTYDLSSYEDFIID